MKIKPYEGNSHPNLLALSLENLNLTQSFEYPKDQTPGKKKYIYM